jgi:RNA polymerase sigma factor (sigma-70 family)
MAEMFGITVIDDASATTQSDEAGIGITVLARLKHAALYEAAKAMGSASALARHLGVSYTELGKWINLKACPPKESLGAASPSWTEERIAIMEAKLHELTGRTWDELWPDELRDNSEFLKAPKHIEKVYNWKQSAMLSYADATRDRLRLQSGHSEESEEKELEREAVESCLHLLSARQRKIISMRYGFNGTPKTLDEVGVAMQVTRETIRQIESKALEKLKRFACLSLAGKYTSPKIVNLEESISSLVLDERVQRLLHYNQITTIGELVDRDADELRQLRDVSQWTITQITRALKLRGLKLKNHNPEMQETT